MPALQVRDFPDDLYERLKACAALEHRSVAQQAIIAVERMLEGSDPFPRARKNPCFIDFGSEAERASRKKKREALFADIEVNKKTLPANIPSAADILREARREHDCRTSEILGLPCDRELE